jgi:H+/Cl- antiporter ClcA
MTTETRAVSAEKGKLTPLVVLVPSLAAVVGAGAVVVRFRGSPLALVVLALGVWLTRRAGARKYDKRLALDTAALTVGAGVLALAILTLWQIGAALGCAEGLTGGWLAVGVAAGSLVHLTAATVGFRSRHPLVAVLCSLVLGLIAMFVVLSLAPDGQIPDCST